MWVSLVLATGPHLHYEFRVNGMHTDPLRVKFPNAKPIESENKEDFTNFALALDLKMNTLKKSFSVQMKKKLKSNLFIGVLSGTSADSIDAGLFKVDKKISFLNFASTKYDEKLKDAILDISRNKKLPSKGVLKDIDNKVGEISAKTINKLIKKLLSRLVKFVQLDLTDKLLCIKKREENISLQVGDPFLIGRETNITTVSNFRQANIKNGGQGAPLTPSFHKEFFKSSTEDRLIINIGGISNMTFLPKKGTPLDGIVVQATV